MPLKEGKIVKSFADFATDKNIKKVAEDLHLQLTARTDVKNILSRRCGVRAEESTKSRREDREGTYEQ